MEAPALATDPLPRPAGAAEHRSGVRLCIIDLGTNSFHAIVVDAFPDGTFTAVDRLKEMVHLGEGGFRQQQLTEAAQERGLAALKRIRAMGDAYGATDYVACATSAVREATNGGTFIERVKDETGLYVRTITGEAEAELIYQAVRQAVDLTEPTLLVDIGGGSTEFIVADRDGVHFLTSLKLGAARMTEMFVTTDPVSEAEFRAMRAHYRKELGPVFRAAHDRGVRRVVGSSGTLESIAAATAAAYGEPGRVHDYVFDATNLRRITKAIMTSDRVQRLGTPGVAEKRVGQIVAGATLIDVVLKDLSIRRFELSPNALREGIVIDFIQQNYQWLRQLASFRSIRRRSVYDLAMRMNWDEPHVRHVTRLALQLFDATQPLHGRGEAERELLEYASILRDTGYAISRRGHHQHSFYVIKHADLRGFRAEEIAVIASVARYHRAGHPTRRHGEYDRLPEDRRRLVDELAALLRLANGLDRSHFQNVTRLEPELSNGCLRLRIRTKADPQLDVWAARRGSALFRRTFKRAVEVVAEA